MIVALSVLIIVESLVFSEIKRKQALREQFLSDPDQIIVLLSGSHCMSRAPICLLLPNQAKLKVAHNFSKKIIEFVGDQTWICRSYIYDYNYIF